MINITSDTIIDIRRDFPILSRQIYNRPLIYLDNAATTQKPKCVVDAIAEEYYNLNANVHRGVHYLSQQATELHESARVKLKNFIGAHSEREIVFTRGTTESLNLLAFSLGEWLLNEGDEVVVSEMEHHSNIVPWQMLRERKGIVLKVIPVDDRGNLLMNEYKALFTERTKLVSIAHVSNVLGTINPVDEMAKIAHDNGCLIIVDGAQSVPHMPINVSQMDCDFLVFSGHKMYGPTGIGVLYGKESLLEKMPPYQGGGEMIKSVSFEKTIYEELPYKFEAGTPDYVGSHALGIAVDYLNQIGMENVARYEDELLCYAMQQMQHVEGMIFYGESVQKDAVISFNIQNIHHLDLGTLLDRLGVAIRTGHHCAQPVMQRFGVEGMARASFALYNTKEEIDAFVAALCRVRQMF